MSPLGLVPHAAVEPGESCTGTKERGQGTITSRFDSRKQLNEVATDRIHGQANRQNVRVEEELQPAAPAAGHGLEVGTAARLILPHTAMVGERSLINESLVIFRPMPIASWDGE